MARSAGARRPVHTSFSPFKSTGAAAPFTSKRRSESRTLFFSRLTGKTNTTSMSRPTVFAATKVPRKAKSKPEK